MDNNHTAACFKGLIDRKEFSRNEREIKDIKIFDIINIEVIILFRTTFAATPTFFSRELLVFRVLNVFHIKTESMKPKVLTVDANENKIS